MSALSNASALLLFLTAALVIAVTPGPGIADVAARTLAGGREEGIASGIGTGLGGIVHVVAGAIGLSALTMASAEAFTVLKIGGAWSPHANASRWDGCGRHAFEVAG